MTPGAGAVSWGDFSELLNMIFGNQLLSVLQLSTCHSGLKARSLPTLYLQIDWLGPSGDLLLPLRAIPHHSTVCSLGQSCAKCLESEEESEPLLYCLDGLHCERKFLAFPSKTVLTCWRHTMSTSIEKFNQPWDGSRRHRKAHCSAAITAHTNHNIYTQGSLEWAALSTSAVFRWRMMYSWGMQRLRKSPENPQH